MKQIKLSDVHYEMMLEVAKKRRVKPENLLEEFIQVEYNKKK